MTEAAPLAAESNQLAQTLTATDDEDGLDSTATSAKQYRRRVQLFDALEGVDRMLQEDVGVTENRQHDYLHHRTWVSCGMDDYA